MFVNTSHPVPLAPRAAAGAVPLRPATDAGDAAPAEDRSIGAIIRQAHQLSAAQVEQVLAHQREHSLRFGEAAIALGFVGHDDVMWALGQQFQYPIASHRERELSRELVMAVEPFSAQAEVFRSLRTQLVMQRPAGETALRAIAVVSPERGDGKSFLAANLAIAFSQLGGRTLLLDADLRNPRQHALFGVDNTTGLSSILSGRETTRVVHPVAELPSLYVLPVGTIAPNPLELVERQAFALLLRDLLGKFDHVIVDTPAATAGADSSVVAARCGAALAVVRRGRSRLRGLQDLVERLRCGPAELVGALINDH